MLWDNQSLISPEDEIKEKLQSLKTRIQEVKDHIDRTNDGYNKEIYRMNVMLDTAQTQYEAWVKILEKMRS